MKKLTSALTTLTICAAALTGCASTAEVTESTTAAPVAETSAEETSEETTETTEEWTMPTQAEIDYNYETEIPLEYTMKYKDGDVGTVEKITYHANDYIGDGEGCDKDAFVYLPANYDPEGQYDVIYLMHGIGGNEFEWGLNLENSELKNILDNLIGRGDIDPIILVTPNGKAWGCRPSNDFESFYDFGYELRNDLIPYIEENYATYAEFNADGYDMSATREHRAMAGLSMGGMQTINIGIGECMDLFSRFGAFSAAPTSNPSNTVAQDIDSSEYKLDYFYNICGTDDDIAYASASGAAKDLIGKCDALVANENFTWQQQPGGHDWPIWYLGIYNFAKIAWAE